MPNSPAQVLSIAARRDAQHDEPLARASATGAAAATPARLFESLSSGDDFGGLDDLTEALARSRDGGHPTSEALGGMVCTLLASLSDTDRETLARLDAAWAMRAACAVEVGFHAGVAAGRAR